MLALVALYGLASPRRRRADGQEDEAGRAGRRTRRPVPPVRERIIALGLRADMPGMRAEPTDVVGEGEDRP